MGRMVTGTVLTAVGLILTVSALLAAPTVADPTGVDSCMTIDEPGAYQLTGNVTNASTDECVRVAASDVVIDGQGYAIEGDSANDSVAIAVGGASTVSNVTVRNVTVTGWSRAVSVDGATGSVKGLDFGDAGSNVTFSFEARDGAVGTAESVPETSKEVFGQALNVTSMSPSGYLNLTMAYEESDLNFGRCSYIIENSSGLYASDGRNWSQVPNATVNTDANTVSANLTEDSTYAVLGYVLSAACYPSDTVADDYDQNGNGEIEITELGEAAADYVRGEISIGELGDVAGVYVQS